MEKYVAADSGAQGLPWMSGTKGDSVPKGMPTSRRGMQGGEGCGSHDSPDREHLEPPKCRGGRSCGHEAFNRGAGPLLALLLLCPGSCLARQPRGSPGHVPAAWLGCVMRGMLTVLAGCWGCWLQWGCHLPWGNRPRCVLWGRESWQSRSFPRQHPDFQGV